MAAGRGRANQQASSEQQSRLTLARLSLILLAISQLTLAQQQQPQTSPFTNANVSHTTRLSGSARALRWIGTAPQDRLSCQSSSASSTSQKRRHLTGSEVSSPLLTLLSPTQGNGLDGLNGSSSSGSFHGHNTTHLAPSPQAQTVSQQQKEQAPKLDSSERLRQLRQLLISNNYDAYLVTPNDEHGSEMVADFDRRLRFISGFTGSNGYALITLDRAVLFTDGRYQLQAELDLDCNWWLVVSNEPILDIPQWVKAHVQKRGLRVATDARLMSLQIFDYLDAELKAQDQAFEFALISLDLIDIVWNNLQGESHQRERPTGSLVVQPLEYTGQVSWQEKALKLAELMRQLKARHYVISKLDDIAWLLNLRGSDIPMAPLFKAYLLISRHPTPASGSGSGSGTDSGLNAQQTATTANGVDQHQSTSRATQAPTQMTTTQAPLQSLEQLLAAAASNQQQNPINTNELPNLQSPQVVQVPSNQVVKITFYVDLRKVTPAIREHLRLDSNAQTNSSSFSGFHFNLNHRESESRIQLELKDYDVFIMDFGDRFRSIQLPPPVNLMQSGGASSNPNDLPAQEVQSSRPGGGGKLLLDAMANVAIHVLAKNYDDRLILVEPLCQRLKSVKSDLEVEGMRQAHWRDSLAIAMLLGQLEHDIGTRKRTDKWTEVSAAQELEFYRSLMDLNRGQSFDSISAYGANGAIIHYKPDPASELQVKIGNKSTYLLDSGGQYLDGTTDITRTVHFGSPSDFERETYTRVLMGAVDMMSLIFEKPLERAPYRLTDLMARRHLFDIGLNYEHGTGHGIGAYSLVHEAPALIANYDLASSKERNSKKSAQGSGGSKLSTTGLVHSDPLSIRENMFTSVEPGFYKAGQFGIRLENIVVTQRAELASENSQTNKSGTWLRFEPISLVPFEPKLIKFELLSNKQKAWLNSYNLMVRLRMTQQINHYLGKLRQQQPQLQQVQVLGTTSSSHLYRQLQEQKQNGSAVNNFARMEQAKFQQLLEQAHRWIMAKTELIPLDVPQHIQHHQQQRRFSNAQMGGRRQPVGSQDQQETHQKSPPASDDEWSSLGADPDGQRLMLAYMSGLPFNDPAAARALTSLSGRSYSTSTSTSNSNSKEKQDNDQKNATNSPPLSMVGAIGQKCVGIECDLLLLEALNSHQKQQSSLSSSSNSQDKAIAYDSVNDGSEQQSELHQGDRHRPAQGHQMLLDLFQISSTADRQSQSGAGDTVWSSLVNMWPILGLALILILQLAVMAYVCGGGGDLNASQSRDRKQSSGCNSGGGATGALNRALSSSFQTRRRREGAAGMALASVAQQQQFVPSQVQAPAQLMTESI